MVRHKDLLESFQAFGGAIREYIFGIKGEYNFYIPDCERLCAVEALAGACIVIKRETFDKLGGFNEDYFLYFEDLDLCKRIHRLGLKVGFDPMISVNHIMGESGLSGTTRDLSIKSSRRYFGSLRFLAIQYIGRMGNKMHGIKVSDES